MKFMMKSEKERQMVENDIQIAQFENDPEARLKNMKNKLENYK